MILCTARSAYYKSMKKYSLPILQELRAVKTPTEIRYLVQAQRIGEKVLQRAVVRLRLGVTEQGLEQFIIRGFIKHGVHALSFPPIVAFGKGTADIHHVPGNARLKHRDIVMIDIGCTVKGYCSDLTRTYFFGEPTARQKRVYLAVLEAQNRALRALASGERKAVTVDRKARVFLHKKFGEKSFPHGLGHGVGTVIHEWPSFRHTSQDVLPTNSVVTVEPGVYIRGWGGVRIEDMVHIEKRGIRNLTSAPKDLVSIILSSK